MMLHRMIGSRISVFAVADVASDGGFGISPSAALTGKIPLVSQR
jgi:hypothetical protein